VGAGSDEAVSGAQALIRATKERQVGVVQGELEGPAVGGVHQPCGDAQQTLAQTGDGLAPGQLEALAQSASGGLPASRASQLCKAFAAYA